MKLVTTEAVMTALCQHCDSHIEMCEDCPMKELIESVPEATLTWKFDGAKRVKMPEIKTMTLEEWKARALAAETKLERLRRATTALLREF
jgi:hypothetical protein